MDTQATSAGNAGTARWRSWRGVAPILAVVAASSLALVVWHAVSDVDRPSALVKFDPAPRRWITGLPSSNALVQFDGEDRADSLLVVGDSRASAAVSMRMLEKETGRPAALLWYGFGQYDLLFEAQRTLSARTLVVCLTPAAVYTPALKRMQVLLEREEAKTWMTRLDDRLDGDLDAWRQELLRPVDPSLYKSWTKLDAVEPERQVGVYVGLLAEHKAERLAGLERLRANIARALADGCRVVCVRLPVMSKLETVEDREFDPQLWRDLCQGLGVPYLDSFGSNDRYATSDGSHLVGADAELYTVELAAWLRAQGVVGR